MTAVTTALAVGGSAALMGELAKVFYFIVLPVLLLAGIGYGLQKRSGMDLKTLTLLNFHFIIPGMIYCSVVSASLSLSSAATIIGFSVLMLVLNMVLTVAVMALRRVPRNQWAAAAMITGFHNSGNFALPLQELAFRPSGLGGPAVAMQALVMIAQNFMNFTIGVVMAASGGPQARHWRDSLGHILRFPPIWALLAGLVTVQLRRAMGDAAPAFAAGVRPFWDTLQYIRGAFFSIALVTLGAQLAQIRREHVVYPVTLVVLLRLLAAPSIGMLLILMLGLKGLVAQVLLISTASPTAVNCMLMCLEFGNHPGFAARSVFYSTLLAPVTVTFVVFIARSGII